MVSSRIQPLLDPYNQTANALRTVVAQIFNVERAGAAAVAKAAAADGASRQPTGSYIDSNLAFSMA